MHISSRFQHLNVDEFLTALDFSPIGMSIIDTNLQLRYCNSAFLHILDFPESLITPGTSMENFFRFNAERGEYGPGDAEEQVQTRMALSRKFEAHQFTRSRNDGRVIEIIGRVMRDQVGQPTGFVSLYQDITKEKTYERELERQHAELSLAYETLKQTQLQLLQSEKMASVGHLAAGIAHEINNPIGFALSGKNAIERYINDLLGLITHYEKLEQHYPEPSRKLMQSNKDIAELALIREDAPALLKEIHQGLTRVKDIVGQLKVFAFDHPNQIAPADLHDIADRSLDVAIHGFGAQVQVHKEYAEIPLINCAAGDLSQVFLALFTNAGQAIAGEGKITVKIACQGEYVRCDISDTGSGITAQDLPHIFDPFFTTKPVGTGTGMGLAMAYSTIKQQGGMLEISSNPGMGACISILLPIH